MKRFIRLVNGQIIDTEKIQDHLFKIPDDTWRTHDERIYRQLINSKELQVAESDNVFDLIQVGDLVVDENNLCAEIVKSITKYENTNKYYIEYHEEYSGEDVEEDMSWFSKIYTKQGDNYILVWDKKRGVL